MANSAQARKRARQASVHRSRNMSQRAKFRTFVKRVEAQVASGDYEAASAAFKDAEPIIDSMVNRNLIHKNKAARHKSRLNQKIRLLAPQS
ncbi:MAG: 30S ribosomal protein S20 [Gammaproteobacteria bacterium]|nr:30S ribosomal protein S20 [Gammaproteobacteria bacterium]MYD80156.1 30S ribosomal protein S20 [Gammaproteobacteria bacterium]